MLERTLVFVDTSYLLASFYNSWDTGARSQLEIDLPEVVNSLGDMITQQLNQPIHRQYWYDGIPDSGPHRYQRALRTCNGVQLRTGQLIEWGERRTQKGVDTRLVTDIVVNALRGQFTDFVLVSGDADMIPGVEEATNAGVRVHLYGFGWDSMSSALRHVCDSTTILDPREDFCDAMQLRVLEGPLPPTIRERPIGDAEPIEQFDGMTAVPDPQRHKDSTTTDADHPAEAPAKVEIGIGEAFPERKPAKSKPAESENEQHQNGQVTTNNAESAPEPAPPVSHEADEPSEVETELVNSQFLPSSTKQASPQPSQLGEPTDSTGVEKDTDSSGSGDATPKPTPKPSMMAPRRKLRSRYLPLPEEVWSSAGFQTPFDVGQQYATWWYENVASGEQRDKAHTLSGGGLPAEIDRPLLQFACETLHEYTLSENQRVNLRDGFHSGIRGVLINFHKE